MMPESTPVSGVMPVRFGLLASRQNNLQRYDYEYELVSLSAAINLF
jgi:hypothetical protein